MKRQTLAAALLLGATAFTTPLMAADKPPIKIGVNLPLSGFQRSYGDMYNISIALAVEDVNKAGGVNGSDLQVVADDDQGQVNETVLLFRRHAGDGVFAQLGPLSGTAWDSVAPLAAGMKLPTLNWTALKPGGSKPPYALRINPPDDAAIPEGVAEFAKKFPNIKSVAITGDAKEASGAAGMAEFEKAATANGIKVVGTVSFDTKTTDYSPVAIQIKGLAPQAVFMSAFGPNALGILKELDVQGVTVPVLGTGLIWAGSFAQTVTVGADRVYAMGFDTNDPAPDKPGHDEFDRRYVMRAEQANSIPKPVNIANASMGYDAVMLLAKVMKEKGVDGSMAPAAARQAIADGLAATKTVSGLNEVTLKPSGDGYIRTHLLKLDPARKAWVYVSP